MQHNDAEIEKQRSMLRGYFGKACRDSEVAETLTQETLYQACRSLSTFRGDCPLSAWVLKIANNVLKKHIERDPYYNGRLVSLDSQISADSLAQGQQNPFSPGPESEVLSAMVVERIFHEMNICCSPEERQVVSMFYQGDSLENIAELLGEKPATIRSQFLRGRSKLLAHLVLNAPHLLGGKECITEAYQTAQRVQEINAREAAAWKSPQGKADDFRSACLKMARHLRITILTWLLWVVLFRHF
jgi:RNA polymerase sigma-70 factor, ECF subfamily